MSKNHDHAYSDYEDEFDMSFMETGLDDDYELDFDEKRVIKKNRKLKNSHHSARKRVEDYFERKAMIEEENYWN